jgi:hypothetical protein
MTTLSDKAVAIVATIQLAGATFVVALAAGGQVAAPRNKENEYDGTHLGIE